MNVQKELISIFRVYQLCGFAPFPLQFNVTKEISKVRQYVWYIYNVIIIVFFGCLVLHNMISYKKFFEGDAARMISYLSFIVISLVRWMAVIIAIESILNSKQHKEFLSQLNDIDNIFMDDLRIKPNYKRMRCVALFWLAVWIIQSVILISFVLEDVMKSDISNWDKFMWFLLTIPIVISSVRYFQIIQYIQSIEFRFEMINTRLCELDESTNRLDTGEKLTKNDITHGDNSGLIVDRIYNEIVCLRQIYHILWQCTGQLNETFRWSLLLLIATSFFIIVVNYYRTLVWLLIDGDKEETEIIVLYFVWSGGHVFYFIKLSSTCHNVLQQVRISEKKHRTIFFR